jgi:hypothetical protein
VAWGNGAPTVTFALLKGAMAGAKRRGGSSAQRHVERGSGGGPRSATASGAAGMRHGHSKQGMGNY